MYPETRWDATERWDKMTHITLVRLLTASRLLLVSRFLASGTIERSFYQESQYNPLTSHIDSHNSLSMADAFKVAGSLGLALNRAVYYGGNTQNNL